MMRRCVANRFVTGSCGFSLVELMVALLITLMLVAGIGRIFLSTRNSARLQDSLVRMQENGRYAMELISTDLRRAGYLGGTADIHSIEDHTPDGVLNEYRIAADDGRCIDSNWVRMLDHPVFGKDDTRSGYSCLRPLAAGSRHVGDILVTRYTAPLVVDDTTTPVFSNQQFYLRTSPFNGKLFAGADEAENRITDRRLVRTAELVANGYYLHESASSPPEQCSTGTKVPALYRIGQVNGALQSREIVAGVDQFQLQYGLDTDGDHSVDRFVDAPPAGDSASWHAVIAVRVWILVRTECPDTSYVDHHTYMMGNVRYQPEDGYHRLLHMRTISLRNPPRQTGHAS
jgi:type IV pilus assembly protein PilW